MKYTNRNNLPDRIIRMLGKIYQPKASRYSVSALCDSPRIRTLLLTRWDDIVVDYSDLLSSVIGISVHSRSEEMNQDEDVEHKYEIIIDGRTVVGKADVYDVFDENIIDTKVRATDFLRFGIKDIEKQLNFYAYQHRILGKPVNKLFADVWYRDWKLWKTIQKDYPRLSYQQLEIPLWTFEQQEKALRSELEYHLTCPMDCPDERRWKKTDAFVVMQKNKKVALAATIDDGQNGRRNMTETEAISYCANHPDKKGTFVLKRGGEFTRCQHSCYCKVHSVCPDSIKGK